MRDHNDIGVLEDTIERRNGRFLFRSIHCQLFPVWRPVWLVLKPCGHRRLRPAARPREAKQRFQILPPVADKPPRSEGSNNGREHAKPDDPFRLDPSMQGIKQGPIPKGRRLKHLQSRTGLPAG